MSWEPLAEALFVDRAARDPGAPVTPFVAIQRVVVRLLFDPDFVERVYADPGRALDGLELDPDLVGQLLRNDRRLWNADRLRRSRSLRILMEEFKVTSTLVLAECRRLTFLDAFFGSAFFHEAVQKRTYMALAFVGYLEDALRRGALRARHVAVALGLEAAMARSRRRLRDARRGFDSGLARVEPGRPGERLVTRPGVLGHRAPSGTIQLIQHIEKYLFQVGQVPALALCDDAPRPEPLPELVDLESEHLGFLLEPQPGGKVELSEVGREFALVIEACERPVTPEDMARLVAPHGIAAEDARDKAESLLEGEVLRRVRVDDDGSVTA
jgi:hypothetical protein